MPDLYDFILGRAELDECMSMVVAGLIKYNNLLDGYVITINKKDYLLQSIPKEGEEVQIYLFTHQSVEELSPKEEIRSEESDHTQ